MFKIYADSFKYRLVAHGLFPKYMGPTVCLMKENKLFYKYLQSHPLLKRLQDV